MSTQVPVDKGGCSPGGAHTVGPRAQWGHTGTAPLPGLPGSPGGCSLSGGGGEPVAFGKQTEMTLVRDRALRSEEQGPRPRQAQVRGARREGGSEPRAGDNGDGVACATSDSGRMLRFSLLPILGPFPLAGFCSGIVTSAGRRGARVHGPPLPPARLQDPGQQGCGRGQGAPLPRPALLVPPPHPDGGTYCPCLPLWSRPSLGFLVWVTARTLTSPPSSLPGEDVRGCGCAPPLPGSRPGSSGPRASNPPVPAPPRALPAAPCLVLLLAQALRGLRGLHLLCLLHQRNGTDPRKRVLLAVCFGVPVAGGGRLRSQMRGGAHPLLSEQRWKASRLGARSLAAPPPSDANVISLGIFWGLLWEGNGRGT